MSSQPTTAASGTTGSDNTRLGILFMLLAIFMFASMDAVAKGLIQNYPPMQVVWARFFGQSVLVLIFLAPGGALRHLRSAHPWAHMLRSAFQLGATSFFFLSLAYIGLAEATAIADMSPVLITLGAAIFLGEKLGARRIGAVVVALIGALIIIRPGSGVFTPAALLPLLCALSYAGNALMTRHLGRKEPPWTALLHAASWVAAELGKGPLRRHRADVGMGRAKLGSRALTRHQREVFRVRVEGRLVIADNGLPGMAAPDGLGLGHAVVATPRAVGGLALALLIIEKGKVPPDTPRGDCGTIRFVQRDAQRRRGRDVLPLGRGEVPAATQVLQQSKHRMGGAQVRRADQLNAIRLRANREGLLAIEAVADHQSLIQRGIGKIRQGAHNDPPGAIAHFHGESRPGDTLQVLRQFSGHAPRCFGSGGRDNDG